MIDHPMIEQIEKTGYPSKDYLDWEREQEEEEKQNDREKIQINRGKN